MARDQHATKMRTLKKPALKRASTNHCHKRTISQNEIDIMSIGIFDTPILGRGTENDPIDMTVETPPPAAPRTSPPAMAMHDRLTVAERAFDMVIGITYDNLNFLRSNLVRQSEIHGDTAYLAAMRLRIQHLEMELGRLQNESLITEARLTPRRLYGPSGEGDIDIESSDSDSDN